MCPHCGYGDPLGRVKNHAEGFAPKTPISLSDILKRAATLVAVTIFGLLLFFANKPSGSNDTQNTTPTINGETYAERRDRRQNERDQATAQKRRQTIAKERQERRQGYHCMNGLTGSNPRFVREVKKNLRAPKTFEHVVTRIQTNPVGGRHIIVMDFRAQNSFGATVTHTATGSFDNSDCSVQLTAIN